MYKTDGEQKDITQADFNESLLYFQCLHCRTTN